MKTNLLLGGIVCAALLTGCMSVPQTQIGYNPKTKAINISSPKDVEIGSVSVMESNGLFVLSVTNYSAKNNIKVIKAVIEGNAKARQAIEENAARTVGTLIDLAK